MQYIWHLTDDYMDAFMHNWTNPQKSKMSQVCQVIDLMHCLFLNWPEVQIKPITPPGGGEQNQHK